METFQPTPQEHKGLLETVMKNDMATNLIT